MSSSFVEAEPGDGVASLCNEIGSLHAERDAYDEI